MSPTISLEINYKYFDVSAVSIVEIREVDELRIVIQNRNINETYTILIEDYEVELFEEGSVLATLNGRYFSEAFGYSSVRVYESGAIISEIQFDIQAKKVNAYQAQKMIEYLVSQSNSSEIIQACLSRSAASLGVDERSKAEPEAIISCIEKLINIFHVSKKEFLSSLRTRLVPVKQPITSLAQNEADPADVISCIGNLVSSDGLGDVVIKGRHYVLDNIDVLKLLETNDVKENQILLGSLYFASSMVAEIDTLLTNLPRNSSSNIDGFESFSHLLLSLTATGLILRCESIMQKIRALINLFEKNLKVSYVGELTPVITPFVRCSKIYKNLFSVIDELYGLGKPKLGNIRALMKLKSLSKIYEIYCFYHLLEFFHKSGLTLISAKPHDSLGALIPSQVVFKNNGSEISVSYEKKIYMYDEFTQHMGLVRNHSGKTYKYYEPDFLVTLTAHKDIRYFIFDAKYSTFFTVRNERLPDIFRKYYDGVSVYDEKNNFFTNSPILAVLAIYPIAEDAPRYISYWPRQGLFNKVPRIPVAGGVPLTIDNAQLFEDSLIKIFDMASKTIPDGKWTPWFKL